MYKSEKMMDKSGDSSLKPDKNCHKDNYCEGTMAKKATLPGQMYTPKKDHNESDFAGEQR